MDRRAFLTAVAAAAASEAAPTQTTPAAPRLGIDLFSIRDSGWTPIQYLDYAARWKAKVVHFSEVRFIGSLDPANLRAVRARAEQLGIEVEIGMKSICPASSMFDVKAGTAQEQLARMIDAARIVGSSIVRAVLGSMDDRRPPGLAARIEDTVQVLRGIRSRAQDANIRIAIENHAGDMQAAELRTLIEEAGNHVGVCLDSGNPLWTLESPHVTLETLHPYVLTSHIRDTAVWRVPEGVAVTWTRMGDGNVDIDSYVHKYAQLCPGRAISLEIIVMGPRIFATENPVFWDNYRDVPAWNYQRFLDLAAKGKPFVPPRVPKELAAERQREDLEASLRYMHKLLKIDAAA